jgi:hypothetical protein
MSESLSELEQISNLLTPLCRAKDKDVTSSTNKIVETYTMERERNIHQEAMNDYQYRPMGATGLNDGFNVNRNSKHQMDITMTNLQPEGLVAEGEDEFGENVELF